MEMKVSMSNDEWRHSHRFLLSINPNFYFFPFQKWMLGTKTNAINMLELTQLFFHHSWPRRKVKQLFIWKSSSQTSNYKILYTLIGIWAYEPSICRSLGASYKEPAKYNGIPLLKYELDLSDPINKKDCFCRNPGECPPEGTFDLFKCAGSPMFGSLPHFYKADPALLEKLEGLSPNKEEHGIFLLFEIVSLVVFKRQISRT